jgi:predicted nucleic acid-binding protein
VGLIDRLPSGPIAVDTAIFIYFVQTATDWLPVVDPLFEAADAGDLQIVTSAITLLELLVFPYRINDAALATQYEVLLTRSLGIQIIDITPSQLHWAARLRARSRVHTPDAIQLAAANHAGCQAFITNGKRLPPVPGLQIIQLSDLRDA